MNPTGVVSASFWLVLGLLLGQVVGVKLTLEYALCYALCYTFVSGTAAGIIGYFLNKDARNSKETFYCRLGVNVAMMLGGTFGAAFVGPQLFSSLSYIPVYVLLIISITIGGAFMGLVAYGTDLIITSFKPSAASSPWSFLIWSNTFAFMILGCCFGINFGLAGWVKGLLYGMASGMILGVTISCINKIPAISKILTSLYAMSGVLSGIMFGIALNSLLPSSLFMGTICGAVFMVIAGYQGFRTGNLIIQQAIVKGEIDEAGAKSYHDWNNPELRRALYLGSFAVPLLFAGYLTGGVYGFHRQIPYGYILTYQAYGAVIASGTYLTGIIGHYLINPIITRFSAQMATNESTVLPAVAVRDSGVAPATVLRFDAAAANDTGIDNTGVGTDQAVRQGRRSICSPQ